jgi:SET domain-containing protein
MGDIVVKESKIQGKGVFASRNFKKGEIVMKWDISRQLTKSEVDKLSENEKRYVAYVDRKYILMQPPARYVNHSCDANTYAENFCDIAKRDIKKGEEITGNYAEEDIPEQSFECKCGSKNCRKIIKS